MEYPRHEGDIRIEYPSKGEFICPQTYAFVNETEQPPFNMQTETILETTPINKNGNWYKNWLVRPYTQEEIDAKKALEEYVKSLSKPSSDITKSGSAPDVIG
jgi:hypothetical protein